MSIRSDMCSFFLCQPRAPPGFHPPLPSPLLVLLLPRPSPPLIKIPRSDSQIALLSEDGANIAYCVARVTQ